MLVDFHTHVFPRQVIADRARYIRRDPVFKLLYEDTRAKIVGAESLVAAMNRAGIDLSVVCGFGWGSQELCQEGNDAIIEAIRTYPNRLVGLGTVDPGAGRRALDEIDRLAQAGLRGLGELRPDDQGMLTMLEEGRGEELKALAEALRRHRMLLLLHASEPLGHAYPGKGTATPDRLERLLPLFEDVPVVLAHWGGGLPFYTLMPEVKKAARNVYVDTAALPHLYDPQILQTARVTIGMDRVLFGTDYPLMPQSKALDYIAAAGLTTQEKEAVLGGNVARLLGLPSS